MPRESFSQQCNLCSTNACQLPYLTCVLPPHSTTVVPSKSTQAHGHMSHKQHIRSLRSGIHQLHLAPKSLSTQAANGCRPLQATQAQKHLILFHGRPLQATARAGLILFRRRPLHATARAGLLLFRRMPQQATARAQAPISIPPQGLTKTPCPTP